MRHSLSMVQLSIRVRANESSQVLHRLPGLRLISFLLIVLAGIWCSPAHAQWMTRTFTLNPGWNAVFMDVEPEPGDCATVFSGLPIDSVWFWNPDRSTVQFVRDPSKLTPRDPDWSVYFPETSVARALTTLRVMRGNRPYLVKVDGTVPVTLTVRGRPSLRGLTWVADAYNLVGFHTDPAGAPTIQQLFAGSPAHAGQSVFRLSQSTQTWEQVANPASETPKFGEAFWVWTSGSSKFQGPLRVESDSHGAVDFGRGATELRLHAYNDSGTAKTCTLRVVDSESPPTGATTSLAGAVPLSYWKNDYAGGDVGWHAYADAQPMTLPIDAGAGKPIRLGVRRRDMTPPTAPDNANYQSIVQISDGAGMLVCVPVTSLGLQTTTGAKDQAHTAAGLWVGSATVNMVSQPEMGDPSSTLNHATPQPSGSEFSFTIIVHVDATGTVRFLQQVTMMWKDGTLKDDPAFAGGKVVDVPGKYVLITDESLLAKFKGATVRGGVQVGRRFSTPAFGFRAPIAMTGTFPTPASAVGTITCPVPLDYDDPLNPFKHKFHPDHNNLDEHYATKLADGDESWSITRDVSLAFADYSASLDDAAYAGWGDKWLGGTYSETITGLHRTPLYVQGTFRLNYVSDVAELNPEN